MKIAMIDRIAGALISWLGGGVQPANRSKIGMFDDAAPIWKFKEALGAIEDPEAARAALEGLYIMEVFPALALAGLNNAFCDRLKGPRYNPERRKTFQLTHWHDVIETIDRAVSQCLELEIMIVPAKEIPCLAVGCMSRLKPPAEIRPAGRVRGALLDGQMRAIDGFHAQRSGYVEHLVRLVFQEVDTEMAGCHGEAMGIERGPGCRCIRVKPAITFHLRITILLQDRSGRILPRSAGGPARSPTIAGQRRWGWARRR